MSGLSEERFLRCPNYALLTATNGVANHPVQTTSKTQHMICFRVSGQAIAQHLDLLDLFNSITILAHNLASISSVQPVPTAMSSIDPLSTSVTQWLFSPAELARSPSQQPSMHPNVGHADDSMTFEQEYSERMEAVKFLAAVEKDLQGHNPVKVQVDNWKAQQKSQRASGMMGMQQGMMGMGMNGMQGMNMGMGGMGMQYGRPGHMGMQQQQGRYGQTPNGHNGADQQVNLDAMSTKDLLAYSGTFGHPNSAEYLHWVNVNQEYEQVCVLHSTRYMCSSLMSACLGIVIRPYARDVAYTAATYLHRFFMRRSMKKCKPKVCHSFT